ncbi:MAG: hypothetical protein ABSF59_05395 [Candidatus Sulfotelmatobacter sp.]|jgi:hypothetical protein
MQILVISLVIHMLLAVGLAGLLWPEKLTPIFEILMYPWPSNQRVIRANCIAAILISVLLFLSLSPLG